MLNYPEEYERLREAALVTYNCDVRLGPDGGVGPVPEGLRVKSTYQQWDMVLAILHGNYGINRNEKKAMSIS